MNKEYTEEEINKLREEYYNNNPTSELHMKWDTLTDGEAFALFSKIYEKEVKIVTDNDNIFKQIKLEKGFEIKVGNQIWKD